LGETIVNRVVLGFVISVVGLTLWSQSVRADEPRCEGGNDPLWISRTLTQIRASVDPCGESPQVVALLDKVERCTVAQYRICVDVQLERNYFDRPRRSSSAVRTIAWNPTLRTPVETSCEGDPSRAVLRDAAASLLHELVHAAQDCDGLEPQRHEFEAVRIENIYRRAAGLCQRRRYGDSPLPSQMVRTCRPGECPCTLPPELVEHARIDDHSRVEGAIAANPQGTPR